MYAGRLYDGYSASSDFRKYSDTLQRIPTPVCVCFYNGTEEEPDRSELRLSDAYEGAGSIEVVVELLNVNYGRSRELMEACRPLKEYAWLVDAVRGHLKEGKTLDQAVDEAVGEMPEDYVIRRFIVKNKAEVKGMFLTEYDEDEAHRQWLEDGVNKVVTNMLACGEPIWKVAKYSELPEGEVRRMAEELGLVNA